MCLFLFFFILLGLECYLSSLSPFCSSSLLVDIHSQQCLAHAARRTLQPVWRKAWVCVCTTCQRSRCSMEDRSVAMATWRREKSVTAGSQRYNQQQRLSSLLAPVEWLCLYHCDHTRQLCATKCATVCLKK